MPAWSMPPEPASQRHAEDLVGLAVERVERRDRAALMGPPDDREELAQERHVARPRPVAADDAIAAMPEPPIESTIMTR